MGRRQGERVTTVRIPPPSPCVTGRADREGGVADGSSAAVPVNPELSRRYRENTHEALTQAVAQGFKDVVILETEPDLDSLRDQPTFQALLASLRKGA
jgi:hypothetical protein